jgi:hypothetical protein
MFMHLSMLIPGGKGAGNLWGFDRESYPHRRAFDKDFCPGAGDLPFDKLLFPVNCETTAFFRRFVIDSFVNYEGHICVPRDHNSLQAACEKLQVSV